MIDAISKRQDYPCLKTHSYLNQASLGLTGEVAVSAMHTFLDETARHGNLRMSDVDEANFLNPLRSRIACLVGTEEKNVAIVSSSSEVLSQVPSLLNPNNGTQVVLVSTDFPALTRPWIAYSQRKDLKLCFVDEKEKHSLTDRIIKNINEQTAAVCVSYVQFSSGTCLNIAKLRAATNTFGARLIVDITQAAGAVPISLTDWAADVVVCSGYKWLGGHGGIAFAIFSNELLEKEPPTVGWFGGENPFDMNAKKLLLAQTAAKYTQSTLSYISAVGLEAALGELLIIGSDRINKHSQNLADLLIKGLSTLEWAPFCQANTKEASSHIITLSTSKLNILSSVERLNKNGVICGVRNNRIRVSIAHYNNSHDINALLQNL